MADNMEGLSGVTAQSMADEDRANAKAFRMENAAAGLTQMPLLILTADDGLAPDSDAFVHAIEAKGGHKITVIHVATDHGWSDHRIALESAIITWLAAALAPKPRRAHYLRSLTPPLTKLLSAFPGKLCLQARGNWRIVRSSR